MEAQKDPKPFMDRLGLLLPKWVCSLWYLKPSSDVISLKTQFFVFAHVFVLTNQNPYIHYTFFTILVPVSLLGKSISTFSICLSSRTSRNGPTVSSVLTHYFTIYMYIYIYIYIYIVVSEFELKNRYCVQSTPSEKAGWLVGWFVGFYGISTFNAKSIFM